MSAPTVSPAVAAAGTQRTPLPPVLGLDVGGTKLAAGVVDGAGRTLSFVVEPTHSERGPVDTIERLLDLGRRAVEESRVGWPEIAAVGIGCGGPLDAKSGTVLGPPHLPGWHAIPLAARAEEAYDRPAALENDATAGAAAEHTYGAGVGTRDLVYLTLSTGVGGGVITGGRLLRGARGNAGELGHIRVGGSRRCDGCGREGCLEAYVSGSSIARRAEEALAADGASGSSLASLGRVTAADVAAAARDGDPLATAVWDETVEMLGCGLTSIVNAFEPEMVVIGGGVSRTGEQLLARVRERVRADALVPGAAGLEVVTAALGDRVGVVGAAAIVFDGIASGAVPARG